MTLRQKHLRRTALPFARWPTTSALRSVDCAPSSFGPNRSPPMIRSNAIVGLSLRAKSDEPLLIWVSNEERSSQGIHQERNGLFSRNISSSVRRHDQLACGNRGVGQDRVRWFSHLRIFPPLYSLSGSARVAKLRFAGSDTRPQVAKLGYAKNESIGKFMASAVL